MLTQKKKIETNSRTLSRLIKNKEKVIEIADLKYLG